MKYLYECHTGGLYITDREVEFDHLYCEQCGDSDILVGTFETIRDFWWLVEEDCDIDHCGGWPLQYIYPLMVGAFRLPDEIRYESDEDVLRGHCCYSDKEILDRINELVEEETANNFTLLGCTSFQLSTADIEKITGGAKCPHCGESYYAEMYSVSTAMYCPPVWKDGVNINPDRNQTTTHCRCLNCGKEFDI